MCRHTGGSTGHRLPTSVIRGFTREGSDVAKYSVHNRIRQTREKREMEGEAMEVAEGNTNAREKKLSKVGREEVGRI